MKIEIPAWINHHFSLNVKTIQDLYWELHYGHITMARSLESDEEIKITLEVDE